MGLTRAKQTARAKSILRRLMELMPRTVRQQLRRRYYSRRGERELRLVPALCDSRRLSLDVGANRGLYALFLMLHSRHVVCFEPNPMLASQLAEEFLGQNVSVVNAALGAEAAELVLRIPKVEDLELDGWASLVADFEGARWKSQEIVSVREVSVRCEALDELDYRDVGFVKIDVEGFEGEVIRGGVRTITRDKPNLLIEIEQRHLGQDMASIFDAVVELGYQGHFLYAGHLEDLSRFDPSQHQNFGDADGRGEYVNNFIFVPIGSATSRRLMTILGG